MNLMLSILGYSENLYLRRSLTRDIFIYAMDVIQMDVDTNKKKENTLDFFINLCQYCQYRFELHCAS